MKNNNRSCEITKCKFEAVLFAYNNNRREKRLILNSGGGKKTLIRTQPPTSTWKATSTQQVADSF